MGTDHSKLPGSVKHLAWICGALLLAAAIILPAVVWAAGDDSGMPAAAKNFVMPRYNRHQLQYLIYGREAKNHGAMLDLKCVVIDVMKKGQQNAKLDYDQYEKYYLKAIENPEQLWSTEKNFSQGMLFSEDAVLDKNTNIVRSDSKVAFRSSILNADGVGFYADMDNESFRVLKNVKVRIRLDAYRQAQEKNKGESETVSKSSEEYFQEAKQEHKTEKSKTVKGDTSK